MTVPRSKLTKRQEISKAVNSILFHGAVEGASAIVNNYKNKEIDKEELILKVEKASPLLGKVVIKSDNSMQ